MGQFEFYVIIVYVYSWMIGVMTEKRPEDEKRTFVVVDIKRRWTKPIASIRIIAKKKTSL